MFPCLYLGLCCNPEPMAALARAEGKSPGAVWPAAAGTRHAAFRPAPQGQLAEPLPTATTVPTTPTTTTAPNTTPSSLRLEHPEPPLLWRGMSGMSGMPPHALWSGMSGMWEKSLCFWEEGGQMEKEISQKNPRDRGPLAARKCQSKRKAAQERCSWIIVLLLQKAPSTSCAQC